MGLLVWEASYISATLPTVSMSPAFSPIEKKVTKGPISGLNQICKHIPHISNNAIGPIQRDRVVLSTPTV